MKCSRCGHEVENNSVFCQNCGGYIFTSAKKSSGYTNNSDNHNPPDQNRYKSGSKTVKGKTLNRETFDEVSVTASRTFKEEEMEEPKRGRGIKAFFLGLFLTVLLISCAAFAGYYAYNYFMGDSTSEYTSSITKLSGDIIKANSDMAAIIKKGGATLPVSDILKQAYTELDAFNKINDTYDNIIAPSTYSESHQKLGEAIKLNKSIYQQLNTILKNPILPDTKKNMDLLSSYIDGCMNNYSQVKVKNVNISLPDEILSISSKIQPWIKQKQAEYGQVASLIASFSKYFDDMAKLFVTYDSAAADFNQTLRAVRSGQENWEKFFTQIDNSDKIVMGVKIDYAKLSVPSELKTINSKFGPILDEQLSYYTKLKLAAQTEKDNEAAAPGTTTVPSETGTQSGNTSTQGSGTQQGNTATQGSTTQPGSTTTQGGATQQGSNTSSGSNRKTGVFVPRETTTPTKSVIDVNPLYQDAEKTGATASENYQKFALELKDMKDKYLDPEFVLKLKSGK